MPDNELDSHSVLRVDRSDARIGMLGLCIVAFVISVILIAVFRGM